MVGRYEMTFPNNSSLGAGAEEIVNCQCVLEFDGANTMFARLGEHSTTQRF